MAPFDSRTEMWRDMSSEVITGGRLILVYFNARLGCPALNMVKISFDRVKKVKLYPRND